jgi:hypothetical protein
LHNLVLYHRNFISGSAPDDDIGFDTLQSLGVKTIISVDGMMPDIEAAHAHNIRYIHLPIGYNGFDEQRKLELVRAARDAIADGPVYIHCHHVQHRSASAAATIAVCLGWLTNDQAIARMKVSGTAPNYKGLYACAAGASELDEQAIDAVPANFPELSRPATFVASMIEIDQISDHLSKIEKAGWRTPPDHPDLVPAAEAGRLADLFRFVSQSDKANSLPADFADRLREDSMRVTDLEKLLAADEKDAKKLSEQFKLVTTSCKACHAKYRD